jgi:hypothetical protein
MGSQEGVPVLAYPHHAKVLRTKLGLLAERATRAEDTERDDSWSIDLSQGFAGNLLALVRSADFMHIPARRARAMKMEIESHIFRNLDDISGTTIGSDISKIQASFAHGLAGIALAVYQSHLKFGTHPRAMELFMGLKVAMDGSPHDGPFCWHRNGAVSVMRHILEEDAGWPEVRRLPAVATMDMCCGIGAYHVARLANLNDLVNYAFPASNGFGIGYFHAAGTTLIRMARTAQAHDPLWGRDILR